ncbi:DUF397 domain-containing protein [Streptomyces nigrescens]|uniref:DUF397 domain-containing protein n=1 Tax=Streptomyces nigrescens TaxID=1920 RepID=A0A640TFF9_STRNI|nr:DUF397 domain-containing protein [Streptomyces libani]WAT96532.1 DUF397 domain-containing protein [Streptomyces libani subsp. libani]GFE21904.1 DUF397 domain-containing protein [Streptomyces libani subsp. libani]GGV89501.1 DUF397 domain-containing protein [Streptomyces libani subsp. libani]
MTTAAAQHTADDVLAWFKSSYSSDEGGDCVEVASCPHAIHIRDSKNPGGPILTLSAAAWSAFLADVAN